MSHADYVRKHAVRELRKAGEVISLEQLRLAVQSDMRSVFGDDFNVRREFFIASLTKKGSRIVICGQDIWLDRVAKPEMISTPSQAVA